MQIQILYTYNVIGIGYLPTLFMAEIPSLICYMLVYFGNDFFLL